MKKKRRKVGRTGQGTRTRLLWKGDSGRLWWDRATGTIRYRPRYGRTIFETSRHELVTAMVLGTNVEGREVQVEGTPAPPVHPELPL